MASNAMRSGVSATLQRAVALHQQGRLSEAQGLYETVLRAQPRNFDALHLSGVLAAQCAQPFRAIELIEEALRCDPRNAAAYAAHTNMASALRVLREPTRALASYDRALGLREDYLVALSGRADLLTELGQWEAALAAYDRAIRHGRGDAEVFFRRANVLCELGRCAEAVAGYDRALALKGERTEVYSNRAAALQRLGQWDAALASCDRAIALDPEHAEAHGNRGNALKGLGRLDEALESYQRAIALKPGVAALHSNVGAVLNELKRWEGALAACDRALALDHRHAEAYCNRGFALHGLGGFDEAVVSCDAAIALRPEHAESYLNRGNALHQLRQFPAALQSYQRALSLRPDYAEAHCARALTQLLIGNLAEAWSEYEWRWASRHGSNIREKRELSQPLWDGSQALADKRILLHAEQGLGDTLQFCRYARRLAERGASVILEVQPALIRLLSGLDGTSGVYARGDTLPEFELQCPLLSLPLAFRTGLDSIPGDTAYLRSDPRRVMEWQARLGAKARPRIGLAWSGSVLHNNDHNRSIPLALLISRLPRGLEYVVVQNDIRDGDRAALRSNAGVVDFSDLLRDFADTAALCECLDVVVSVDTSVAHLSAALGKPTWVLLPFIPDWRWLLDRTDTPWYPSARLFRQECARDWPAVLERVAADLREEFPAAAIS
jgi:tetratricopeptide (TPR) repeat protein